VEIDVLRSSVDVATVLGNIGLQCVILRVFGSNFTMFGIWFRAFFLDKNSFFSDVAAKGSLDIFLDMTILLGASYPRIRAGLSWLKIVFVQKVNIRLRWL
jgi:hypothetical protein